MFVTFDILAEKLSQYTGYKYVVPTDCCTHGVELCLRYKNFSYIEVPKRTYISIPFLATP